MDEYVKLFLIIMLLFASSILLYSYDSLQAILGSFFLLSIACYMLMYLY
jgi:hypothetical protein